MAESSGAPSPKAAAASPKAASSPPASAIPQKRAYDDTNAPAVSSPLNPDFESTTPKEKPTKQSRAKEKAAMHREPREKKESLKKREATGGQGRSTPDPVVTTVASTLGPTRYKLPERKPTDYLPPKGPMFVPHHPIDGSSGPEDAQYCEVSEQYGHQILTPSLVAC